jgi:hypothetical protein
MRDYCRRLPRGFASLLAVVCFGTSYVGAAASGAKAIGGAFESADIGDSPIAGATAVADDGLDLTAAGNDIGGMIDQFRFAYGEQFGDFDLRVRVLALDNTDVWAKAGLMARESLEPTSRFAAAFATPNLSGCFFQGRTSPGAAGIAAGSFRVNYPFTWLRLKRSGDVFTGYASLDGCRWQMLSASTVAMTNVLVGVGVTSHTTNRMATAQFRDWGDAADNGVSSSPSHVESPGPSSRRTGLTITEIMYHPAARSDGKNLEFVELFNSNPFFEDISGYRLSGEIDYTFPVGTVLGGGSFLVVAKAPADVRAVYGLTNVVGPFAKTVGDSGTIRLRDKIDSVLLEVPYSNRPPWPVAGDGTGHSLVLARPSYGEGNAAAWAASAFKGGSPGAVDPVYGGPLSPVVINEFLANADGSSDDYIELYNHSNQTIDLSGCFLSDDPASDKFMIARGTEIPARGYVVFNRNELGFALSAAGETIYLVNPDRTRVLDAVRFEGQAPGVSMGRHADGAAQFYPLAEKSPGAANGAILIRDVVINEVMYNPISGNAADQYVELLNRGSQPVKVGGWKFVAGIDFTFPADQVLPAGGYLVVARDVARLQSNYGNLTAANTVGNFTGKLSGRGERLALAMAETIISTNKQGHIETNTFYIVVDEVTYGTGGRWGKRSDGDGSSLELIDARGDHRLAANWADSDETRKAEWTTVEATGVMSDGYGPIDSLHVLLLGAGECLLDNVEVLVEGNTTNLVTNSTFESGLAGWTAQGDHISSTLEGSEGYQSSQSLRIRASRQGDTGANRIRVPLARSSSLTSGKTVTLRAKARWLHGFPELLLRLNGNWMEAFGRLNLPGNVGTPGARNSRAVDNAGPAISEVTHTPPLPAADQSAVVTARVDDPDGLSALVLNYRVDPATNNITQVAMFDDGTGGDAIADDGVYSATIPAQATGKLVAFFIEATDRSAARVTTRFPDDAPARECLIRFGEPVPVSSFGTYRLWLTAATVSAWNKRLILSNEELDGTFVYGDQRVIYGVGCRYSGSPWHQNSYGTLSGLVTIAMTVPKDDLLLGTTSFNKLHVPGNTPGDDATIQCEQIAYWMVRQLGLPWNYQRYVNFYVNGTRKGKLIEDTQVPGPDVISEHFPDDDEGDLYKLNGWYEYGYAASGSMPFNLASWCTLNNYTNADGTKRLARYRWNWAGRAQHGTANDFKNLFALIDAANTPLSGPYTENMEAVADMEQWMRTFAIEHAVGNWDSFGHQNAQNMYAYKPMQDRWKLLIWDFNIVLGNSSSYELNLNTLSQYNYADRAMGSIYNNPAFMRTYLRTLREIALGPMVKTNVEPVMDARFAAFKASGISVTAPSNIKGYISRQRTFLLNYLTNFAAPFSIAGADSGNVSSDRNWYELAGTAPIEVNNLVINGRECQAAWDDVLTWRVRVPLNAQTNRITVQGLDGAGKPIPGAAGYITVRFTGTIELPQDHLVINEIMYAPPRPNTEFVEIYNTSINSAFDLTGYQLRGVDFAFPLGTMIEPGGYLVVVGNRAAFMAAYGSSIPIAGEFNEQLDTAGETLQLVKPGATPAEDLIIDEVSYSAAAPWPAEANGTGSSLQLIDPAREAREVRNWAAVRPDIAVRPDWRFVHVTGTAASSRLLVYHSPYQAPVDPQDVAGKWSGTINFGASQLYNMTVQLNRDASNRWAGMFYGDDYSGPLAGIRATNSIVSFQLASVGGSPIWQGKLAVDGQSITGTFSQSGQSFSFSLGRQVDPGLVFGGDVYIDDLKLVAGPVPGVGQNLVRNGDFEAQLDGIWNIASNHMATSLSSEAKKSGNASLHLIASLGGKGQETAVWQDTDPLTAGAEYTLSYWYLPSANGTDLTVRLDDSSLASTHSIHPDRQATPGQRNSVLSAPVDLPLVFLSEAEPVNTKGIVDHMGHHEPWVELVNLGSTPASLDGFFLLDGLTSTSRWMFPPGATIQPGEYLIVWLDGQTAESTATEWHANFRAPPANGLIVLTYQSEGEMTVLDALEYGAIEADFSIGFESGTATGQRRIFAMPSPGAPSPSKSPVGLVRINEWMASNTHALVDAATGRYEDWFELYNCADAAIDLSGHFLTDDPDNKTKWAIPAGTFIAPHAYLLVWADGGATQRDGSEHLHAGFKLDQAGESIGLFTSEGRLVDLVTFGRQASDISQGRWPDGADGPFQSWSVPTPGAANTPPAVPAGVRIHQIAMSAGGQVRIRWIAQAGRTYHVQFKDTLNDPVWIDIRQTIQAAGSSVEFTEVLPSGHPQRFYRVLTGP